jgi:adenosylmethionine-8-amino-7-oxononanoate aminotransferase
MPGVPDILAALPSSDRPILIETFGGPFSPLTDDTLQIELIRKFGLPVVLVTSSRIGAIARTLQTVRAIESFGADVVQIVLLGPEDPFAGTQIQKHTGNKQVAGFWLPEGEWSAASLVAAARAQSGPLKAVAECVEVGWLVDWSTDDDCTPADHRRVWHPYTPLQSPDRPLPVVAAGDEFLTLADGRRVIDGISSWWTILHGHRNPAIMQAIRDATYQLDHVLFAGATHPHAVELADHLLSAMPWPVGGRVFYSDNGSTAVEVALKIAYQFWCHRSEPQRTLFVGFENGYHGDTFGAMSVGRDPVFFGRFEPLLFRAIQVPVSAELLDQALTRHRGEVAAVIIEPLVQGAGGMQMHSPEELEAIIQVARAHNVLFVADEVMTGFGRTGTLWAFQQAGIAPDLVCLAKGITGGVLPLAATMVAPEVVAAFDTPDRAKTFFHGHSFTANPITCAAAVASWSQLQARRWRHDVARIEQFWHTHLRPLASLPGVKEVRIRGVIGAVEMDVAGGYLADIGATMRRACLDRGVLLRPLGNVLYAMPPFCTSDESLAAIIDAMAAAIRA